MKGDPERRAERFDLALLVLSAVVAMIVVIASLSNHEGAVP